MDCNQRRGPDHDRAASRDELIERLKVIVPDVLESRLGHAPRDVSIIINWQELRTFERTELMVA